MKAEAEDKHLQNTITRPNCLLLFRTCWTLTSAESCFHSLSPPVSRTNNVIMKHIFSTSFTPPCNTDFINATWWWHVISVVYCRCRSGRFLRFLAQMGVRRVSMHAADCCNVTQQRRKVNTANHQTKSPFAATCGGTLWQLHGCLAKHARNESTFRYYLKMMNIRKVFKEYWDKWTFLNSLTMSRQ